MQLTSGKEEVEEKTERVIEDLQCECLPFYFSYATLDTCLAYSCFFVEYQHQAHA